MGAMASQINSLTIVYSSVYSGIDQRNHQSSASLAFVWEIHRWPVNFPHKWPVTRKMFPFDDSIMTKRIQPFAFLAIYEVIPAVADGFPLENQYPKSVFMSWRHHGLQILPYNQHYGDVTMGAIASHITSLTIVYSTVNSDADQRKHQSSTSLAFVRGIHRWPVNSQHKWPVTRTMFPFGDVIMRFCRLSGNLFKPVTFEHRPVKLYLFDRCYVNDIYIDLNRWCHSIGMQKVNFRKNCIVCHTH